MNKKKLIGVTFLLLIIFAWFANFYGSEPVHEPQVAVEPVEQLPNPYVEKLLADYESEMVDLMNKTKNPGLAIAIVQDSTILYMRGFGTREVGTTDSVNTHTVFRLASVSKCFAPVLTGLLVEDNLLRWDDQVVRHFPDFQLKSHEKTQALKITHVLSHTTGLPYHTYTTLVEDGLELTAMLAELKNVNLIAEPGDMYSYQNVAYSIISEVIKGASGKSYESLMEDKVFKRLDMKDASISYEAIMANDNVARPHLLWRKGWKAIKISDTYYNVAPAGGVNASISDMAQWLKAMLSTNEKFIQKKTLDKIFTPVVKAKTKNRYFRKWIGKSDSHYALGWRVLNFKNDTLLYHGGYVAGYRSEVALDRRSNIGICVLSNGPGRLVDNSVPMFFNLFYNQRDSILSWQNRKIIAGHGPLVNR
jgi:beta-lactamase class C